MSFAIATAASRFGIKGSDAAALLQHAGFSIPVRPNSVIHWQSHAPAGSGRCLRQGSNEFLIELDSAHALPDLSSTSFPNAWLLIRSDHSLVLSGSYWPARLSRLCSFDFARLQDEPDQVVMTLLAGISVTLIREPSSQSTGLRLWCDASFSDYLQQCLHSIGGSR